MRREYGHRVCFLPTDGFRTSQGCPLHFIEGHRLQGMRQPAGPYGVPYPSHTQRVCQGLDERCAVVHRDVAASMLICARGMGEVFPNAPRQKLDSYRRPPRP